jgi:ACS family hexuronate transporter-like MFS transporter
MADRVQQTHPSRAPSWKWWVCALLLLASAINYMDRQTLANAAVRITAQFQLSQEQYGNLSLLLAGLWDRFIGVRGGGRSRLGALGLSLGALVMVGHGFATGLVNSYDALLACRTLLGLFEAGHWPCAIKATQRLLEPRDRSMGNSVLQSGTSIGAIATPLIMRVLLTDELSSWRFAFQIVGLIGLVWIALWFALVRQGELPVQTVAKEKSRPGQTRPKAFGKSSLAGACWLWWL